MLEIRVWRRSLTDLTGVQRHLPKPPRSSMIMGRCVEAYIITKSSPLGSLDEMTCADRPVPPAHQVPAPTPSTVNPRRPQLGPNQTGKYLYKYPHERVYAYFRRDLHEYLREYLYKYLYEYLHE